MNHSLKSRIPTIVFTIILTVIMLFSSVMTVFAWSDFTQSKTNDFRGTVAKTTVTLHKYETDKDGNITAIPVRNAEFALYQVYADGTERKIGGTYTTDQSGKITVGKLSSGTYKFVETNPGYGYDYALDSGGNPIKEYTFEITADDALGLAIKEVDAYNVRKTSGLEVNKTVTGVNPGGGERCGCKQAI